MKRLMSTVSLHAAWCSPSLSSRYKEGRNARLQKIMETHQGMGEVASPKSLDGGEKINSILNFCDSAEGIYDAFINPKYKVINT